MTFWPWLAKTRDFCRSTPSSYQIQHHVPRQCKPTMHSSTPQPQPMRFPSFRYLLMSQSTSSPSSMVDDTDSPPTESSPPTQQPPPALPSGTEQDQNPSPASVSLGLSTSTFSETSTALAPPASSSSMPDNTTSPPSGLLSIPEELLTHTLSFLPAREIALSCRSVCSELRNFIDHHENHIAGLKIKRKRANL
jgi:hypothetical protein